MTSIDELRQRGDLGFALAVAGIAVALTIVVIGVSVIAALNRAVPKELWGIAGALAGALAGLLATPPRKAQSATDPAAAAGKPLLAASQGAKAAVTEKEVQVHRLNAQLDGLADRLPDVLTSVRNTSGADAAAAKPRQVAREAVDAVANELDSSVEPIDEIVKRAVADANATAGEQPESGTAERVNVARESALGAARNTVTRAIRDKRAAANQELQAALQAAAQVSQSGDQVKATVLDRLANVPSLRGDSSAQLAAVMFTQALPAVEGDARKAVQDRAKQAAQDEAAKVAQEEGSVRPLLSMLTEPKIAVPLLIFGVALVLALMLGTGLVHATSACPLNETAKPQSQCSLYVATLSQASSVLIALASAAAGAVLGLFGARQAQGSTSSGSDAQVAG